MDLVLAAEFAPLDVPLPDPHPGRVQGEPERRRIVWIGSHEIVHRSDDAPRRGASGGMTPPPPSVAVSRFRQNYVQTQGGPLVCSATCSANHRRSMTTAFEGRAIRR